MRHFLFFCFLSIILSSCAGYRFNQQENPFSHYGIKSLSIPMFYNYSSLPHVAGEFTRETYRLFSYYPGLELKSGYNSSADAVLIGIISSDEQLMSTTIPANLLVAQSKVPESTRGAREDFYIPSSTSLNLRLQIVLIKKPTLDEIALFKEGFSQSIIPNDRVLLNITIPINGMYNRDIYDGKAGAINATQGRGAQDRTIQELAIQAARNIKNMVIYAF